MPHDRLVKWVFTRPEAAAVQLRQALPSVLVDRLDWSTIAVQPGSYVDQELEERHSDVLYSVNFRESSSSALVYVLAEHQSSPDRMMAWRLFEYSSRVWSRYVRQQPEPVRHLPLLIPLLLYQGPNGCTQPRRLSELIDMPDSLRGCFESPIELSFEVDEFNASVLSDRRGRDGIAALVEIARSLLRLAFHPNEITRERLAPLAPLFDEVMSALGVDDIHALWTYVISVFPPQSPMRSILSTITSPEQQHMYATIYDEAIAKGIAKGVEQGRVRTQVAMVLRVLDKRGLALSDAQRQRVQACSDETQLDEWFDRALTATTADEVFSPAGE
ncbi:MAG: Rpn family recombination-promoting nuclease/putative transposase [Myxococcota bacterium]